MPPSPRLFWIDHLRTGMVMLVVVLHSGVTYSHVGDWYAMSAHEPTLLVKLPFFVGIVLLQSFFMGLLFFIAGYFAERSLARKGAGAFLRERGVRLGLPTLLYMLAIHPFILLALNPWNKKFPPAPQFYREYVGSGRFVSSTGPMWFALALLIFSLVFAVWRGVRPPTPTAAPVPPPSAGQIVGFGLLLGLATFAVRLSQPIGKSVFNMQLCYFVQYLAAFVLGIKASRGQWLVPLARSDVARRAGWAALFAGPVALTALFFCGIFQGRFADFTGGGHLEAFALAMVEQVTGTGLALGALAWFARKFDGDTAFWRWMDARSFAVYVLHAPILVGLFLLYRALPDQPYLLALLLAVTGLVASFGIADLARRIPGLRAIL